MGAILLTSKINMELTQILGFVGTFIIAAAYIPQIYHLIRNHCAYGLSISAWTLWLLATILVVPQALAVGDKVFVVLLGIHIIAISFILIFSYFHQDRICEKHKIL